MMLPPSRISVEAPLRLSRAPPKSADANELRPGRPAVSGRCAVMQNNEHVA